MTPERWSQLKEIFFFLADQPEEGIPAGLHAACGNDAELEQELKNLLAQCSAMGSFLDEAPKGSASRLLAGNELLCDRYEIIRCVGAGGMGEVYEAYDRQFKETVALKVIHQGTQSAAVAAERFVREAQLARKVTHRNVCRIFDIHGDRLHGEEVLFLTMELVHGETLSTRLKREGRIEQGEALSIALQLCSGLEAVHHSGVLHRDLKPSNVMLEQEDGEWRAVLTDFGIAKWLQQATDQERTNGTGNLLATPAYAAPEQLEGKKLTTASDVYSLGTVLFEIVTGRRPFADSSAWREAIKRLTEAPPSPSSVVAGLDPRWDTALLGCLQRDPENRFKSAAQVWKALDARRARMRRLLKRGTFASSLLISLATGTLVYKQPWTPALPAQKHVAVLPFEFAGQDAGEQAKAYGLAESLASDLDEAGTGDSLWVAPWIEVQKQIRDHNPHIGPSLGVNLVLSGSTEERDGRLHVRLSLKDANTLKELRSSQLQISEAVPLEQAVAERAFALLQIRVGKEALRRLAAAETTSPGAYQFYEEGRGYLARRDPENTDLAITLFQTAIQRDSSFAPAYADLALAYSWKYRDTKEARWYTQADEACRHALALNHNLVPAHLALASLDLDSGKLDDSIREFELTLQLEPTNVEARNLLARAYDAAGRPLQAESLLKDGLRRNPGIWINYNDLGYFYYRHAQYVEAEPLFRTAAELAPGNPRPLADLGGVYLALGKYELARLTLARAVSVKASAGTLSNLGTAEYYLRRYAEAADNFQKAVALRPGDSRLWRNLGDALSLSGAKDQAANAYLKVIHLAQANLALHPHDPQQLQNLAVCYAKLGSKPQAENALAQAPASARSDPEFLFSSALVYELNGKRDAALAALRSAIQAGYSPGDIQHAAELSQLRADRRYQELQPEATTTR